VQHQTGPGASAVQHDHFAPQILGARIRWRWTSIRRRQIVEQLDPRSGLGAQAGDPHTRARNGGEPFLLDPPILAGAGDAQTTRRRGQWG